MKITKKRKIKFNFEFKSTIERWDDIFKSILISPIPGIGLTYVKRFDSFTYLTHNYGIEFVFLVFRFRAKVSIFVRRK
jgi:hypothetical protein